MAIERGISCVVEISCWMGQNELKLNQDKTDILLIDSRFHITPAFDCLQFRAGEKIGSPSPESYKLYVTSLGVILEKHMTFNEQIDQVCRFPIHQLRNLFRNRKYLDVNSASKVVHAFIIGRLDYCNHLYFGLSKYKIKKLQRIQNIAANCFVTFVKKYEHITPTLVQFHSHHFVYKTLNGLCPPYLAELLLPRKSIRTLSSSS